MFSVKKHILDGNILYTRAIKVHGPVGFVLDHAVPETLRHLFLRHPSKIESSYSARNNVVILKIIHIAYKPVSEIILLPDRRTS